MKYLQTVHVSTITIKLIKYLKNRVERLLYPPLLEYAPDGWHSVLNESDNVGWNATNVVTAEKAKWDAFGAVIAGTEPLGFSHEHADFADNRVVPFHNVHITYGYVLALAAHQKATLSVLDYGGGLGHYFQIGKALLPDILLDFHCKEMASIAEAGKMLNPDILWHTDDGCMKRKYDLVMINGSLQYLENWQQFLRDISESVGDYLFLTRVPVIEKADSFVAVQNIYGTHMLHGQFNQNDLLQVVKDTGLTLFREFVVGDRPYIKNAPEQCELRGWLFRKNK